MSTEIKVKYKKINSASCQGIIFHLKNKQTWSTKITKTKIKPKKND